MMGALERVFRRRERGWVHWNVCFGGGREDGCIGTCVSEEGERMGALERVFRRKNTAGAKLRRENDDKLKEKPRRPQDMENIRLK